MSSRIPPACESAPAPALWVRGGGGIAWERNAAGAAWAPTAHWTDGEWASLAEAVLQACSRGEAECDCPMLQIRWRAVPVDDAVLAWLMPLQPAEDPEAQALREQVARLADQLRVAQEVGRLGVWERDLRSGR